MASTPSNTFSSGTFSSRASQCFSSLVSRGNSPLYVSTRPSFRASAWKLFSASLSRNDTVSALMANALKSSHCLQRTMTGGPRVWGSSRGEDSSFIRLATSDCMEARRSSTRSIFVVISPPVPSFPVTLLSSVMRRSRSFSCSFRTLMMKSRASRASFLPGFFVIGVSPFFVIVYKLFVWSMSILVDCLNKHNALLNNIVMKASIYILTILF